MAIEPTTIKMPTVAKSPGLPTDTGSPTFLLSPALVEALRLAANGYTAAGSARQLAISSRAVKARLSRARAAMGATSTTQAVALAVQYRLIEVVNR